MFIPIRHDRPLRSVPWLTWALIGANVLLFALGLRQLQELDAWQAENFDVPLDAAENYAKHVEIAPLARFWLWPAGGPGFHWWQLLSSAFLHGSWMHLIGNMLFLWIFGGAVEDRLGKPGYAAFYLGAAAAAGGLNLWVGGDAPMLGASGAITGVTGAFLVLFPQVHVRFVYWFIFIGTLDVPALWVIALFFAKDLLFLALDGAGTGGVAYGAHIGGFLFGFGTAALLLATRILKREPQWDLLAIWQHKLRGMRHRRILRESPGGGAFAAGGGTLAFKGRDAKPVPPALLQARHDLAAKAAGDLPGAAADYARLLAGHPDCVFHADLQEQLAGALTRAGDPAASAAWRLLTEAHPSDRRRPQWLLMRAMLCSRAGDRAQARTLALEAAPALSGEEKTLAERLAAG